MTNLLFSYGGINDSGGMRGGQISNKLIGSYEGLTLAAQQHIDSNKIVIILKDWAHNLKALEFLKRNGNKILLDVIDWLDVDKYHPNLNINEPNFFPHLYKEYFDGYIVNNSRMKNWWQRNMDNDINKPIFIIPHHWDERFSKLPEHKYEHVPYFYYLGYRGHENQNCLYVEKLLNDGLLYDDRQGSRYFADKPVDGCQISIRKEGSWEYCFKPCTKLSIAASMESVMITTYDWSVMDILPSNYPYLLLSTEYEDVVNMFKKVKETYNTSEWFLAKNMMEHVKNHSSIDYIASLYTQIEKHFQR